MKNIFAVTLLTLSFVVVGSAQKKSAAKSAPKTRFPKNFVYHKLPVPPKAIKPENWTVFSSISAKFKISFPKPPEESSKMGSDFGITYSAYNAQSYINGNYYLVNMYEYPRDFLPKKSDLGETYSAWLAKNILKVDSIIAVKKIGYGGYSGYEFTYKQADDVVILRTVVVGQNLYQLVLNLEPKEKETYDKTIERNREKIDKFFDSFTLVDAVYVDPNAG
jgi:hypothetical protein